MKYTVKAGVKTPVFLLTNWIAPSVASTLAALSVVAGAEPNSPSVLREIVVTAARLPDGTIPLNEFPASVTVVTREQIAQSPAFSLTELLRQQLGFSSLDTAGFGSGAPQFSFRGYADKAGTLVLVDGLKINDFGGGFFSASSIPLSAIERVEMIRGGASTTYGEGAAGGVINIITKKADNRPLAGSIGASVGNLGYNQNNFTLSGNKDNFSLLLAGSRGERTGWRDNSAFRGRNFLAKPSVETPIGRFTLGYQFSDEQSEAPANLTPAEFAANPRQSGTTPVSGEQEIHRGWLDYHHLLNDAWTVNGKVFATKDDARSHSRLATVLTSQPSYGLTLQTDYKTQPFGHENTLTLGGEYVRQDFTQIVLSAFGNSTTIHDSTTFSLFAQDAFKLTPKLTFTGGTRFDHRRSFLSVPFPAFTGSKKNELWSPKGSLNYEFAKKSSAWVSLSQAYRLPSASDAVSADPRYASNPSLVPLNARTIEVGMRSGRFELIGASLSAYRSSVKDDIYSDPTGSSKNANVVRQGAELAFDLHPAKWMDCDVSTAYTDAHFTNGLYQGQRQVLVPDWEIKGGVNLRPVHGWTWRVEASHLTGVVRFFDLPNTLPKSAYTLVNTKVSYQLRGYAAYVAVNNIFNERYEQFPSYSPFGAPELRCNPAPGINFQVGVNLAF